MPKGYKKDGTKLGFKKGQTPWNKGTKGLQIGWSKGLKGIYKHTDEQRKRISERLKGHKVSEETRKKIGLSKIGNKYCLGKHWKMSEKAKRKLSKRMKLNPLNYWLGKKRSIEDIEKFRKSHLGHKLSEDTKRKLSESHRGEKSYLWKGGISYQPYPYNWTNTLRDSIRQRDNYICQICGKNQTELIGMHKKLSVHHIDYNKHNLNINNLITLCKNCHVKTNHRREYWIKYFKI